MNTSRTWHQHSGLVACVAATKSVREAGSLLDLRQVASAFQYVLLDGDRITQAELQGLLPRHHPKVGNWLLAGDVGIGLFFRFRPGEVLIFGFAGKVNGLTKLTTNLQPQEIVTMTRSGRRRRRAPFWGQYALQEPGEVSRQVPALAFSGSFI